MVRNCFIALEKGKAIAVIYASMQTQDKHSASAGQTRVEPYDKLSFAAIAHHSALLF